MNSERHNNWEIFHVLKHACGDVQRGEKCTKNMAKRKVMIITSDHKPVVDKYQAPTLICV
jgi:hypothetical protein